MKNRWHPQSATQQADNGRLVITRFNKAAARRWWTRNVHRDDSLRKADGRILRLTSKLRYRTKPCVISTTGSIVSENIGRFYGTDRAPRVPEMALENAIDGRQLAKLHLASRDK